MFYGMLQLQNLDTYLLCFVLQYTSVCVADLYQVNRTTTLCYSDVAEFICSQNEPFASWRVTSSSSGERSRVLSFHTVFAPEERVKSTTVDSTPVTAQLISGNSSFSLSSLIIEATLSTIISCNTEMIMYFPQDKSTLVPSDIILTPTANSSPSYNITWTSSYYNSSDYMIIVYPPESYTQEHLIINTDNNTVYNITVALTYCPHRIYSTFILGCALVSIPDVIDFRVTANGRMTVHLLHNDSILQCTNNSWDTGFPTTATTHDASQSYSTALKFDLNSDSSTNCECENIRLMETQCNSLSVILSVVLTFVLTVIIYTIILVILIKTRKGKHDNLRNRPMRSTEFNDQKYKSIQATQFRNAQITTNMNAAYSTVLLDKSLSSVQEGIVVNAEEPYDFPIFKKGHVINEVWDPRKSGNTETTVLPPK